MLFFMLCVITGAKSQVNVLGKPGYIMVPSARWDVERPFGLSASYIPQAYAVNYFMKAYYDELIYGVRLGITDFLEFNLNITYLPDRERIGIGDRHADIRLRLLKEKKLRPDLVLIASPPGTAANYLAHNVLVATKNLDLKSYGALSYTLGYSLPYALGNAPKGKNSQVIDKGFGFYSKESLRIRYLNGFFSALSYQPFPWMGLMAEYDGEDFHGGFFLKYKTIGSVQLNAYGLETLGGSFNLSFPLNFEMRELRRYGK